MLNLQSSFTELILLSNITQHKANIIQQRCLKASICEHWNPSHISFLAARAAFCEFLFLHKHCCSGLQIVALMQVLRVASCRSYASPCAGIIAIGAGSTLPCAGHVSCTSAYRQSGKGVLQHQYCKITWAL